MLKRILIGIVMLLALSSMYGCAGFVAGIDVDAALAVAADVNLANVRTATQDKMNIRDRELAKVEAIFEQSLAASTGGAEAVKLLVQYRAKKAEVQTLKEGDMAQYAKMLDNAGLMVQLIGQRIALRARWNALLGRIPAVSHLTVLAETEAREYMQAISKGAPQ